MELHVCKQCKTHGQEFWCILVSLPWIPCTSGPLAPQHAMQGCHMLTNDALAVLNQPLGAPAPHTWALPPCAGSLRSSEHADLSSAEVNDIVTITGGLPTSGTSMSSEVAVAMIGSGLRHLSLHGAWAVGDRGLTAIASLTGLQALQVSSKSLRLV